MTPLEEWGLCIFIILSTIAHGRSARRIRELRRLVTTHWDDVLKPFPEVVYRLVQDAVAKNAKENAK